MKKIMFAVILCVSLMSCGSRKVHKTEIEEIKKEVVEIKKVDSSKVIKNTNIETKVIDSSEGSEIEISPIDKTKPFIYKGDTVKNAILRIKKHKNNIAIDKIEKVSEINQKHIVFAKKERKDSSKKTSIKKSERIESILSYWWILVLIIVGYVLYKKYIK